MYEPYSHQKIKYLLILFLNKLFKKKKFYLLYQKLFKKVKDWTIKDVSTWLKNIELNEYIENFQKNHINGKNLLDITESELKNDL